LQHQQRIRHHSIPNLSSADPFAGIPLNCNQMALVSHPATSTQIFQNSASGAQKIINSSIDNNKTTSKGSSSMLHHTNGTTAANIQQLQQNGGSSSVLTHSASNAILTAAQPFCQSPAISSQEFTPDRPIGYGAFGVVW
jgi:hypothetical protein